MRALIIIDLQNDFLSEGSLAITNANRIIPIINQLEDYFELIVATQDWHPRNHKSFASNHKNKKPFEQINLNNLPQTLWPDHCVQGTFGAHFPAELNTNPIETIFRKGTSPNWDSYSAFYDNGHTKTTGLSGYLKAKEVRDLYFCGLSADFCVYFSIKDALIEKFNCYLIEDATCPINPNDYEEIKKELLTQGVTLITSEEIINF